MTEVNDVVSRSFERWLGPIELQRQQVIKVVVVGLAAGVVSWGLTQFLNGSLLSPVLCTNQANTRCTESLVVSSGIATIIAAVVGLLGLVRTGVYRPLLVVAATSVGLWGLGAFVSGLSWYEGLAWAGILYALHYVAFFWLARQRSLISALLTTIGTVVIIRVLLVT